MNVISSLLKQCASNNYLCKEICSVKQLKVWNIYYILPPLPFINHTWKNKYMGDIQWLNQSNYTCKLHHTSQSTRPSFAKQAVHKPNSRHPLYITLHKTHILLKKIKRSKQVNNRLYISIRHNIHVSQLQPYLDK